MYALVLMGLYEYANSGDSLLIGILDTFYLVMYLVYSSNLLLCVSYYDWKE